MTTRDVYGMEQKWKNAKANLLADKTISESNKELCIAWLDEKETQLTEGLTLSQKQEKRLKYIKTLSKYAGNLRNVARWFPDLKNITKAELETVKKKLYNNELLGTCGRPTTCASDYVRKLFKGDKSFFTFLGHEKITQEVFKVSRRLEPSDVEFIRISDLQKICEHVSQFHIKTAFEVLFYSGLRIGELLNLRVDDIELKIGKNSKTPYYLIHVRATTSKSNTSRTIPLMDIGTIEHLQTFLADKKDNVLVFPFSYTTYAKTLQDVCEKYKIYTQPYPQHKKLPHIHTLRKSSTLYWLNQKYTSDQIKAFLGHKPSSTIIDVYLNYSGIDHEPKIESIQAEDLRGKREELEQREKKLLEMELRLEEEQKRMLEQMDNKLDLFEKLLKQSIRAKNKVDPKMDVETVREAYRLSASRKHKS